jgi:hypothetical protein
VVLALLLFEPWLANRISMRHYAKPRDLPEAPAIRGGRWSPAPGQESVPTGREVSP